MRPYEIVMRRRLVPRYNNHQVDITVLPRLPPGVRAEEVDRLGVELFDEAPNDLFKYAFGQRVHALIVPQRQESQTLDPNPRRILRPYHTLTGPGKEAAQTRHPGIQHFGRQ